MANSAQFYEQMAARTAEQITGSYQEWTCARHRRPSLQTIPLP